MEFLLDLLEFESASSLVSLFFRFLEIVILEFEFERHVVVYHRMNGLLVHGNVVYCISDILYLVWIFFAFLHEETDDAIESYEVCRVDVFFSQCF